MKNMQDHRLIKMYNDPKTDWPPQAVWFKQSQVLRVEDVVGGSTHCLVYLENRDIPLICFGSSDEVVKQIKMGGRK